jgi:F1F0 ATPase subunit 2
MQDLLALAVYLAAGALLGLAFFGSLRWTLTRLATARRPRLALAAALLVRWALLGGALVLAVRLGGWAGTAATMAGLVAARYLLTWRTLGAAGRRAEG